MNLAGEYRNVLVMGATTCLNGRPAHSIGRPQAFDGSASSHRRQFPGDGLPHFGFRQAARKTGCPRDRADRETGRPIGRAPAAPNVLGSEAVG